MILEELAFERLFAMPALECLRSLRVQLLANPNMAVEEAITVIKAGGLDGLGLDFEAGKALLSLIPFDTPNDGPSFYRGCIRVVLLTYQPVWARVMLKGRSRFYTALERDEQSLFRQAGILDEPPDDGFVEWWDGLTKELRLVNDLEKMARAREAERLSLAYEAQRLRNEGIDETPKWIGLDDNTKGYDVLSYDRDGNQIVNKLIEVKSTIASPLRFRLTRNEWEQAARSGTAYIFHVWDMSRTPPQLFIRTVEQVRPHIPSDNEKGKWNDAEIPVGT